MNEGSKTIFWCENAPPPLFIQSTGTYHNSYETANNGSCISVGICPVATTKVELAVYVTPGAYIQAWPYLLGAQSYNDSADTCGVRGYAYGSPFTSSSIARPWAMFRWGHANWTTPVDGLAGWSTTEDWHVIRVSRTSLIVDAEHICSPSASSSRYSACSIAVGSINRNGTFPNYIPHDLAYCKVWNSQQLVRDMKPFMKDGIAGMHDDISGQFFSSAVQSKQYQYFEK